MFRWLGLNIIIRTKIIKLSDFSSYIGFLDLTFGQSNPCLNHHLDTNKIFFKTDHNVVSMLIIFFAASINRLSIIHKSLLRKKPICKLLTLISNLQLQNYIYNLKRIDRIEGKSNPCSYTF